MANRAVFINVGFDPTATLESISALSLSSGDLLVVVYPKAGEESSRLRGEQTRSQIKAHIDMLGALGRRIEYREVEVDLNHISDSMGLLADALREAGERGFKIYLELTGGVRAITILMVILSLWVPRHIEAITLISETSRERIYLPVISPTILNDRTTRRILGVISSCGDVKRRELSSRLGISESSVSRSVSRLKRLGLVREEVRVLSLDDRFRPFSTLFSRLST